MLANTEFKSLEELAIAADKVIQAQKTRSKTANVVETRPEGDQGEVDAVGARKGPGAVRKGGQGKSNGKTRLATGQKGSCFYHDKHGPAAFKCEGGGCVWSHIPLAAPPSSSSGAGNSTAGR